MPHCTVPNCTNGWRKTKGTGVSYHRLPTNHMKSLWLQRVRRDNPRDSKHSFVCSDHFSPESYESSLAEKLCGHTGRKILKPDAVPTIFKHSENVPKTKRRVSSEMRCRVRERNEVLYYIYYASGWFYKLVSCHWKFIPWKT
jgi:hypothetical protein